jgi:hypothetical protein
MPLLIALAALAATAPPPAARPLDPIAFFEGRSHGDGRLSVLLKKPVTIRVDSVGRRVGRALVLDQRIQEQGKPARNRRWVLRPTSAGRFTGTLTDATGPVVVTSDDRTIEIRYPMKNGLQVEQTLTPIEGGRAIDNVMKVRKFGLPVATLREHIRKR